MDEEKQLDQPEGDTKKKETTQDQNSDLPKVTVVPEKMAHLEKGAQLGKPKEPKKEKPK